VQELIQQGLKDLQMLKVSAVLWVSFFFLESDAREEREREGEKERDP
jgi:hypothetical protein